MQIAVTCKKRYVEGTIGSLECEGYCIRGKPIRYDMSSDTDMSKYLVVGERAHDNISATAEFAALYLAGWFRYENETYRIVDNHGGDIRWPPTMNY